MRHAFSGQWLKGVCLFSGHSLVEKRFSQLRACTRTHVVSMQNENNRGKETNLFISWYRARWSSHRPPQTCRYRTSPYNFRHLFSRRRCGERRTKSTSSISTSTSKSTSTNSTNTTRSEDTPPADNGTHGACPDGSAHPIFFWSENCRSLHWTTPITRSDWSPARGLCGPRCFEAAFVGIRQSLIHGRKHDITP